MKKIDHTYKNFNIDKFLKLLKNFNSTSTHDFINDIIISSIDRFNSSDDEDLYFHMYLEQLVTTGEFFDKLKNYFTINHFYENVIYEDGYWNGAFLLFCKKDKAYRLFNVEYERNSNDVIYLLDTIKSPTDNKTILDDKYLLKILDKHTKKYWGDLYPEKPWDEVYKEFDSPKYIKVKNSNFFYEKKYYEKNYKEALELEHKDRTPDGKIPNDKTPEKKTYDGELLDGKMNGLGTLTIKDEYKYIGTFKDNLFHGQGTFISNNGDKYVGQWKDGEMEGKGTFNKPNGEQYVGEFKKNKKHGKGSCTFSFGDQYVGEYKNDVYDGKGIFTGSDGKITSGLFKNGKFIK